MSFGPCLCGDTHCPSCGPAQGNWRCPICRCWADDGCEHIADDGTIKPEFAAQVAQIEADQRAADDAYAAQLEEEERLAEEYWKNQELKGMDRITPDGESEEDIVGPPSKSPHNYPLSINDAMAVTIAATEAFMAIDFATLPRYEARGVVLMYDQIMQRVKPQLPRTPATEFIFTTLDKLEQVANAIRLANQLAQPFRSEVG